jgi:hypothetical protein
VPGAGNPSLLTKAKQDMKAERELIVLEAAKTQTGISYERRRTCLAWQILGYNGTDAHCKR